MTGFVCFHREAINHPLLKDPSKLGAWFWLVAKAAWKPTKFDIKGKIVTLERGQLCVSVRQLSNEWGWSKSAVEHFFLRLKSETMIGTDSGTGRTIVTICNYGKYQDKIQANETLSGTPSETSARHQQDTKEQGNKGTINLLDKSNSFNNPRAREKPLPENWFYKPTPATQKIVDNWPPGMLDANISKFKKHAHQTNRLAKDWNAAFRTWIKKTNDWKQNDNRNSNYKLEPATDPVAQAISNRRAERLDREQRELRDNGGSWTENISGA